ncbi:hypothetical protein BJY52DRAFT_1356350 [Lactarius psammicola]|nr:hypothetical protein BJY52DRAFT_1356350 [Lactarius psammicola]
MPIHCEFDITQRSLNFPCPFVDVPRLAHGIRGLDIGNEDRVRFMSTLQHITKSSADCHITTWANTILYSAVADVFALAPCDLDFLTGEHMRSLWKNPNDPASVRIDFERPFVTPPKVVVFLNCFDFDKSHNWRLKTTATDIDVEGFMLNIETWSDTTFYAARVGWIAYPEDRGHIFSTSVNTQDIRPANQPQHRHSKEILFNSVEFTKKPSAFIALNSLDISNNGNLHIIAYVDGISTTHLVWHIDACGSTTLYSAGATIIAFN